MFPSFLYLLNSPQTVLTLVAGTLLTLLLWGAGVEGVPTAAAESGVGKSQVRTFKVFLFAGQSNMVGADAIVAGQKDRFVLPHFYT